MNLYFINSVEGILENKFKSDVIKILDKCQKLHSIYIFLSWKFGSHHIGIVDKSKKNAQA